MRVESKCTRSISASVVMTERCDRDGRQAAASSPIPSSIARGAGVRSGASTMERIAVTSDSSE
jgi:hypothetical protein